MATQTPEKTATRNKAQAAKPGFVPVLVHAYRRKPHLDGAGNEQDVIVACFGEKVRFRANDKGHIVGLVKTEAAFNRLTKEIPEAYIPYAGDEDAVDDAVDLATANQQAIVAAAERKRPEGKYVLQNGDEYKVLDDMDDEEVRLFAQMVGIEADALPDVLKGETLKLAVFNTLNTGE